MLSGHCHHLSVAPTCHFDSNSFATLLRNLSLLRLSIPSQDSSKAQSKATIGMTSHTRCFPCPSLEQDLRNGKMMTMTLYPSQRGFCIVVLAGKPVLLLPCKILDITILTYKPSRKKYI